MPAGHRVFHHGWWDGTLSLFLPSHVKRHNRRERESTQACWFSENDRPVAAYATPRAGVLSITCHCCLTIQSPRVLESTELSPYQSHLCFPTALFYVVVSFILETFLPIVLSTSACAVLGQFSVSYKPIVFCSQSQDSYASSSHRSVSPDPLLFDFIYFSHRVHFHSPATLVRSSHALSQSHLNIFIAVQIVYYS